MVGVGALATAYILRTDTESRDRVVLVLGTTCNENLLERVGGGGGEVWVLPDSEVLLMMS